jgi:hypothetical protein
MEENVDLDFEGRKTVGLEVSEDGTWEVSAVVTDFQDQASGPSALAEGVVVDTEPPSLTVAPLGAASDEFGYEVTTDVGAQVTVQSESEALVDSFVAEEERTEIRVPVAAGDHAVTVIAGDEFGNEARDVLAREVGGGGGFPLLILIIVAIIVVFGIFAFLKRDELRDWWYSRQYH